MSELKGACIIGQSGGPTAVINASALGVIRTALDTDCITRVLGAANGIRGVLDDKLYDMGEEDAAELELLKYTPSSALGSCRYKLADPDVDDTDYKRILEIFQKYDVRYFFYNGGNDSMDTCSKINQLSLKEGLDIRVVGIPKTIDNDLNITDHSPGYGSAARYAAISSAELALDAAALPIHVVVMELMGRNAGWITAASAMASRLTDCNQLVYLPELTVDMDKMLADIENVYAEGKGLLVTVSEGLRAQNGKMLGDTGIVDGFGHSVPGGTAAYISKQVMARLNIKSRAEKPGLLGRTSMPYISPVDREEAYRVGRSAFDYANAGLSGVMVAIRADRQGAYKSEMFPVKLSEVANVERKFPLEWISGGRIQDEFFEYVTPLMGGNLPAYCDFKVF